MRSYGCELQPPIYDFVAGFRAKGLINHLQITIPNTITFEKALEFSSAHPTIAHSNLLNTFGSNNWDELNRVKNQLKSLNPLHVVEHFTCFRKDNQKYGVCFEPATTPSANQIADNLLRWQDCLKTPVCLENVAVTENVDAYLELLFNVLKITQCNLACDVPHFLISMASSKKSQQEIVSICKDLNPVQLHIGGIHIADGMIGDNHKAHSKWVSSWAHEYFPEAKYITLEQNHKINASTIQRNLQDAMDIKQDMPADFYESKGLAHEALNDHLAREISQLNSFKGTSRHRHPAPETESSQSPIDLYDKYLPFLYPVESINSCIHSMSAKEAVAAIGNLSRWSLSYLSWWSPNSCRYAHINYGEGDVTLFSKQISDLAIAPLEQGIKKIRFNSDNGFWVEIATP